jgi:hypothetical protein
VATIASNNNSSSDFSEVLQSEISATKIDSSEDNLEESSSKGLIDQARPGRH